MFLPLLLVVIGELEREENLIAAVRHIVKALGPNKTLTSDAKKILADLGTRLSSMSIRSEKDEGKQGQGEDGGDDHDGSDDLHDDYDDDEGVSAIEERLNVIQEKIMRCKTGILIIYI